LTIACGKIRIPEFPGFFCDRLAKKLKKTIFVLEVFAFKVWIRSQLEVNRLSQKGTQNTQSKHKESLDLFPCIPCLVLQNTFEKAQE
jgi:hypothetical protein